MTAPTGAPIRRRKLDPFAVMRAQHAARRSRARLTIKRALVARTLAQALRADGDSLDALATLAPIDSRALAGDLDRAAIDLHAAADDLRARALDVERVIA